MLRIWNCLHRIQLNNFIRAKSKWLIPYQTRFEPYFLPLLLQNTGEIWEQGCLGNAKCKAIVQRIDLTCKTEALTVSEVGAYIAAHLKAAGGTDGLFEKDAIKLIANSSGGIPRVINKICTQGLLYAMSQSAKVVTGEMISSVFANEELPDIVLSK